MLIAIVLAVVPPLTLGLVHRSTQPQNTSFFAVDSYAVYTVWLANVTTGWYKSLDIRIFSNSTSDQKITVYTIPLSNYLAITPSNISIQCDQTLGQPMSIIPPWYNISLQKAYLNARTHFLYRVCISQPSQIIDVGVHIFLISNDTDQTGYLNYILTGDTASALLSNNTTIGLSQTGCVSVNMTVPKNAFYYTATSVTSPQPPNTLVIFTMNCTSAMQITRVNEYNGDTCTANSNEPCSISLPGSEAVVNTNHQKIAILAKAPTNISDMKLQTIAIADMASTWIAIAVGIVFIGLVLFAIIGITITKKYIHVHVLSR